MFMLKSTHFKLMEELRDDCWHDGLKAGLESTKLLEAQIKNLEQQLREAKRRDSNGRFKKFEGDFLTR